MWHAGIVKVRRADLVEELQEILRLRDREERRQRRIYSDGLPAEMATLLVWASGEELQRNFGPIAESNGAEWMVRARRLAAVVRGYAAARIGAFLRRRVVERRMGQWWAGDGFIGWLAIAEYGDVWDWAVGTAVAAEAQARAQAETPPDPRWLDRKALLEALWDRIGQIYRREVMADWEALQPADEVLRRLVGGDLRMTCTAVGRAAKPEAVRQMRCMEDVEGLELCEIYGSDAEVGLDGEEPKKIKEGQR